MDTKHITLFEAHMLEILRSSYTAVLDAIEVKGELSAESEATVKEAITSAKNSFDPNDKTLGQRQASTANAGAASPQSVAKAAASATPATGKKSKK